MIKKKDMQEEGWTDMREMEGMNAWAACIAKTVGATDPLINFFYSVRTAGLL